MRHIDLDLLFGKDLSYKEILFLIEKFKNKINWSYIFQIKGLKSSFIDQYKELLDWKKISQYQILSLEKYFFLSKII